MKILIQNGRVIDPASGLDQTCDIAIAAGRIVGVNRVPPDFAPKRVVDATGCIVLPGLVDLAARLREPGHEHEGMLESEMAAAVAGGVPSLVCPPDTDPVLDEPGLVEMLKMRAEKLHQARVFPMFFISSALYPLWKFEEAGALWLRQLADFNPFTHAVEAIRFASVGLFNGQATLVVLACAIAFFWLALWGYDPQRGWMKQRGAA